LRAALEEMGRSTRPSRKWDGHTAVLEAARRWAQSEPRVRALLVKGSLGRRQADALSDVDLIIVSNPGQRDALWRDHRALPEALGQPVAVFKEAPWHRPYIAIAIFEGPLKVDLTFEDGEVPPEEGLAEGYLMLMDRGGVERRLRSRLASFSPPPFRAEHLAELDAHAWDWTWWLYVKLARGERWLVYLELPKYLENIVIQAYNALAGAPGSSTYGLDRRLSESVADEMAVALPRGPTPEELHRSLLALVALYARARARLRRRLRADLSGRLMRQVRGRIKVLPEARR
jgi:predicted nucleotidyltransferase